MKKKNTSVEVVSPTAENEIDSFVISHVENNDNDCSLTLDLIENAYKTIKHKEN